MSLADGFVRDKMRNWFKKYWLVLFGGALTIPDIVQDIFWLLNSD